MPITATNESTFKLVPAGVYVARCYSMLELGTQEIIFGGDTKNVRQVNITWELPTELTVFHEEKGEEPYSVSKTYTLSMHENATLRKDLESWRGAPFTEAECKAFDITKLLGVQCQLNIVHEPSKDGKKTFAKVNTVIPVTKGLTVPPQINKTRLLCFDNFDWNAYKELPDWLREKIGKSPEYKAIAGYNQEMQEASTEKEPVSDNLPF